MNVDDYISEVRASANRMTHASRQLEIRRILDVVDVTDKPFFTRIETVYSLTCMLKTMVELVGVNTTRAWYRHSRYRLDDYCPEDYLLKIDAGSGYRDWCKAVAKVCGEGYRLVYWDNGYVEDEAGVWQPPVDGYYVDRDSYDPDVMYQERPPVPVTPEERRVSRPFYKKDETDV